MRKLEDHAQNPCCESYNLHLASAFEVGVLGADHFTGKAGDMGCGLNRSQLQVIVG